MKRKEITELRRQGKQFELKTRKGKRGKKRSGRSTRPSWQLPIARFREKEEKKGDQADKARVPGGRLEDIIRGGDELRALVLC